MKIFIAKIRLLSTSEGVRKTGIISGYRPNVSFADDINTDVKFEILNATALNPGSESMVSLSPPNFETIQPFLHFGSQFIIRKGIKIVGQGIVIEVVEQAENNIQLPKAS